MLPRSFGASTKERGAETAVARPSTAGPRLPRHVALAQLPNRLGRPVLLTALCSLTLFLSGCDLVEPPNASVAPVAALPRATPSQTAIESLAARPIVAGATVRRADLAAALRVRARVVAANESPLAFRRDGFVQSLWVKPGDQVEPGALLAELADPALDDSLQRARADLAMARAELAAASAPALPGGAAQAAASLAAARQGVEVARLRLAKLQAGPTDDDVRSAEQAVEKARNALWGAQAERDGLCNPTYPKHICEAASARVSTAELAVTAAQDGLARLSKGPRPEDVALAEADVVAAEKAVEVARARHEHEVELERATAAQREAAIRLREERVRQAEAEVSRLEAHLAELRLTAPFAGVIASLDAQVGDRVTPYQPFGLLADPKQLELEASVSEADVGWVTPGQAAQFALDVAPTERYRASVRAILGKPSLVQGKRVYQVRLAIPDGSQMPATVRAGAEVYLAVTKPQALVVPLGALQGDEASRYVEVPADGGTRRVPVVAGLASESEVEIVSGLREGEAVVVRQAPGTR